MNVLNISAYYFHALKKRSDFLHMHLCMHLVYTKYVPECIFKQPTSTFQEGWGT